MAQVATRPHGSSNGSFTRGRKPFGARNGPRSEPRIIHQSFFKSVGPRTYAAQVKEIANGNHLLVLTEGKRDKETNEVRKTCLFIYAEDFPTFFQMVEQAKSFIDAHPVSKEAKAKREKFWSRQKQEDRAIAKTPEAEPSDDLDD